MRRCAALLVCLSCVVASPPAAAQDLDAAIADALAHAPALAEAQAQEAAAAARADRARAERNPLLRVEGSAGVGRIDNRGFFGIPAANVDPLALQVTAEMPLYAGGRVAAGIAQARSGAEAARLGTAQARLSTVVGAVSAYAEVLTARRLAERYGRLVRALAEAERQAGLRYKAGEIASSEVAQASARRAEGEAGLAQAGGRQVAAEAALRRLTGKPVGTLAALPGLPATPPTLDEALDLARAHNPALGQARAGVDAARAGVTAARAEGLPTLGAFAEGGHVRDQFFPGYKADSVAVGLRGRWALWSGGRVAASTRAATADLQAAQARAQAADEALEGLVIDAWTGLATARRMVLAGEVRRDAANEALRGTRLENSVGARPVLAVLDAEREAIAAEAALAEAEAMQARAAWQLTALTGTMPQEDR